MRSFNAFLEGFDSSDVSIIPNTDIVHLVHAPAMGHGRLAQDIRVLAGGEMSTGSNVVAPPLDKRVGGGRLRLPLQDLTPWHLRLTNVSGGEAAAALNKSGTGSAQKSLWGPGRIYK
jgi:hypothetical protein